MNLHALNGGHDAEGIDHGDLLLAFAEAVYGEDEAKIAPLRARLCERAGIGALVDAAAVVANFQRMVRIADGTGITLGVMESFSAEVRAELDLERFVRAKGLLD